MYHVIYSLRDDTSLKDINRISLENLDHPSIIGVWPYGQPGQLPIATICCIID